MVREGLRDNAWVRDIAGELSVDVVVQFLALWEAVASVPRSLEVEDSFTWKWTPSGSFTAKSAYQLLFEGTTGLPGAMNIWHSFAPMKFKLHAWLALRRRC
jgi:hypothetical protein